MNSLRIPLAALFCLMFAGVAVAQDAPAEKTVEIDGSVPKEMLGKWKVGEIIVLKNGDAVKKALEDLKRPTRDAKVAAEGVEKFTQVKKKPTGNKAKKFEQDQKAAEKKYAAKLTVYEEAVKKFKSVLNENTLSKIELSEKNTFKATTPVSASLYFTISQSERGYLWVEKARSRIEFTSANWMRDPTFTPKPEPPKK